MNTRLKNYAKTRDVLSYTSTDDLVKLVLKGMVGQGWGVNSIIDIEGTKIFAKTIPITKTDLAHMYDTSNIHNLPVCYNYGVGSARFGCWRELAFHVKTSNWVVGGKCPCFPILYHHRIIESKSIAAKLKKHKFDKKYFDYWNSDKNIEKFLSGRSNTTHFIVMCLEYFPLALYEANIDKNINWYWKQMLIILKFLKENKVIHFDAHMGNLITDEKIIILTDFGLVLDKSFDLSKQEIAFFDRNTNYDKAMMISNMSEPIFEHIFKPATMKKFEKKYGFDKNTEKEVFENIVFDNLGEICEKFDPNYVRVMKKYRREAIAYNVFIHNLRRDPTKSVVFPNNAF